MNDVALNGHQKRTKPLDQDAEGVMLGKERRVACARPRDAEHEEHRGAEENTRQRTAYAAFENKREHAAHRAIGLPVFTEKPEDEVQRSQQRTGQHEVVIGQRIQSAEKRQRTEMRTIAHDHFHAEQNEREEGDDLCKMIKLRIDEREGGKRVQHTAQQRKPFILHHPAQIAK